MPNLAHTLADGIYRDLQSRRSTVRFLGMREYRFALDPEDHCDVFVNGDYEETLYDYNDLLDFACEFTAKSLYRHLMTQLNDADTATLIHDGVTYTFAYDDAYNVFRMSENGRFKSVFSRRSELIDWLTVLMKGE